MLRVTNWSCSCIPSVSCKRGGHIIAPFLWDGVIGSVVYISSVLNSEKNIPSILLLWITLITLSLLFPTCMGPPPDAPLHALMLLYIQTGLGLEDLSYSPQRRWPQESDLKEMSNTGSKMQPTHIKRPGDLLVFPRLTISVPLLFWSLISILFELRDSVRKSVLKLQRTAWKFRQSSC